MYKLQNYNSELGEILGFIDNEGNKWLSAKQIGKWLEIKNIRDNLLNLDKENKQLITSSNVNNVYIRNLANRGEWFVNYEGFLEICFILFQFI